MDGRRSAGGVPTESWRRSGRLAVVQRDEDVARLAIALDDAAAVGVLHGLADVPEQGEPPAGRDLYELRRGAYAADPGAYV